MWQAAAEAWKWRLAAQWRPQLAVWAWLTDARWVYRQAWVWRSASRWEVLPVAWEWESPLVRRRQQRWRSGSVSLRSSGVYALLCLTVIPGRSSSQWRMASAVRACCMAEWVRKRERGQQAIVQVAVRQHLSHASIIAPRPDAVKHVCVVSCACRVRRFIPPRHQGKLGVLMPWW